MTPAHIAVRNGKADFLKVLLKAKADIDITIIAIVTTSTEF